MGIADEHPNMVDDVIMPIMAHGVATISIGCMKESPDQVIAWRGPMLDRALSQLLTDVYWGDLDFLLVDLPPGTGDMPMSVGRQLPNASVIVVTTPNAAAYEVAERAGTLAGRMSQPVIGVVENMSWLDVKCPDCGKTHRVELFGSGGGVAVADALTAHLDDPVPLLAQIPMDEEVRQGGDDGRPVVLAAPNSPAANAINALAKKLI
ncbi:MAG: Mrp/NBP35 family ATP-binding protein, partial [Micrococcales bacterium]|nr:Mrp/NBP35 family ATP-binding protein [Micrococcales bacterium]